METDGNTDMAKPIVAFPNSAKDPKTCIGKYSTPYVYTAKLIAEIWGSPSVIYQNKSLFESDNGYSKNMLKFLAKVLPPHSEFLLKVEYSS